MCEEASRARVVLAGPTVQNPHLSTWNRSTLDTTIIEEKIWKTHNAIFPVIFLKLNFKKKKQHQKQNPKHLSLRHLLLAGALDNCCAEVSEYNDCNNNKKYNYAKSILFCSLSSTSAFLSNFF